MMALRYLDSAFDDVREITTRLESEHAGFGVSFAELFDAMIEKIKATPRFFGRTEDGLRGIETRECYIARFEYRVIYALRQTDIFIIGVIHARRRPGSWTNRLTDLPS